MVLETEFAQLMPVMISEHRNFELKLLIDKKIIMQFNYFFIEHAEMRFMVIKAKFCSFSLQN